jgi:glycine/D-amino acid oxidase-like deaminating enzyme
LTGDGPFRMDLLSPRPFWPIQDGLPATFPPLSEDLNCDVAIVGAGISGALIASFLGSAGLDVVVLDRREVAHGSTAGNTGLLLYELDVMLHVLARQLGRTAAERAYLRCRDAVASLGRFVRRGRIACDFAPMRSIFLAATPAHLPRLKREFEARRTAGLAVEWWDRRRIKRESSLPHHGAIVSAEAAQLDAYRFTYGVLGEAQRHGVRIFDQTNVIRRVVRRAGIELETSRGGRVRAREIVLATGYAAHEALADRIGALHSTYALASEPLAAGDMTGWPADSVIWDTNDPYLYLRSTSDRRLIIGGYDEPFSSPTARDRRLKRKCAALQRRFRQFFPAIPMEVATAWAGTFGESDDGLPLIGKHPNVPHTWFALGFGGNGTTFSYIAAEIIRDGILGRCDRDADLFGLDRLTR